MQFEEVDKVMVFSFSGSSFVRFKGAWSFFFFCYVVELKRSNLCALQQLDSMILVFTSRFSLNWGVNSCFFPFLFFKTTGAGTLSTFQESKKVIPKADI